MLYTAFEMPLRLVIIEDELPILQLYKLKFELEGFDVSTATNGFEGLRVIKAEKPDIVLLDIRMPKMTGDEMLMKMRATEWGAEVPVIILTNLSREEAPSSLRFLNVARYIVKAHYTPTQVVTIVREVLGIK